MTGKRRIISLLFGGAAVLWLVAVMALPGAAYETPFDSAAQVGDRQFFEQPPLVIPAAAFSVIGVAPSSAEYFFFSGGGYVRGGYACVSAPVYLPQDARIRRVYASLYDGEAGASARVYLYRVANLAQTTTEMAFLETPADLAAVQIVVDHGINAPVVNYPEYAYYAFACLDTANTRLYSLRIYYDTHLYLPAVFKSTR